MNPVVHFELPYENSERVAAFYASAFAWSMQPLGPDMGNYILVTTAMTDAKPGAPAGAINGGLYQKKADWPAQYPAIVIAVDDINASMTRVIQAGGRVLGEPMAIPDVGLYVSFLDTEGNRNSMLQPDAVMAPA
jgi:predicted enzyme related to lactoylglutathione lyase